MTVFRRARFLSSLLAALAAPAFAQTIVAPTFVVRDPADPVLAADPYVAASEDGTLLFAWRELVSGDSSSRTAFTQHYDAAGAPLATAVRVDAGLDAISPEISAAATGGWVLSFRRIVSQPSLNLTAYGRHLDSGGVPSSPPFRVDDNQSLSGFVSVAALPTGAVFQWGSARHVARARL